ncbi:hypothetical protein [Acidipropionibacterium acidipropionici]|uniref:hypothetical protein n=1 Tax=Acidipropionibacterium acidipropionici TaxID=1748 RepID=UPI0012B5BDE1|nr:hypothetical protein [Acidipropionibacterium acidipropionici]
MSDIDHVRRTTGHRVVGPIAAESAAPDLEALTRRLLEAWDAYAGQDVDAFIRTWAAFLAGDDTPCPEAADGLHSITDGSCDLCARRNYI